MRMVRGVGNCRCCGVVGVDICQLIDVVGVILRNISGGGDRC